MRLITWLTRYQYEAARAEADAQGIALTQMVRNLLNDFLGLEGDEQGYVFPEEDE